MRYPLGGFAAVVAAIHRLAVEQDATVRLNTEVTELLIDDRTRTPRATGVRVRNSTGQLEEIRADLVVSGIKGKLPELKHHNLLLSREWAADFEVVFDGPQPERPLGASQSIYVTMPSATDPTVAPEGHENIFILVPVRAHEQVGCGDLYQQGVSAEVEAIADAAIAQLESWAGVPDLGERVVVRKTVGPANFAERFHAWRGGSIGPVHSLRQSAFLRGKNQSSKVDGLYYAGATTMPGVGVPLCLISAENVVKRLRGDTSPGPLPEDTLGRG